MYKGHSFATKGKADFKAHFSHVQQPLFRHGYDVY